MQHVNELCSSCSVDLSLCRNREGKTAKEAFVKNKEDLRKKSIEWVQFLMESSSWLSVFVATVAFAAVLTLPGGLNQETGFPMLLNHPFFHVFIIAIVLCFSCYCMKMALFVSIYTSPFRFEDFEFSILTRITLAVKFNLYGVSMLALAFAATIVLIVQQTKERWTRIGFYTIGFLPFTLLSVSFMPVYLYFWRAKKALFITPVKGPRDTGFCFITPPPSTPSVV